FEEQELGTDQARHPVMDGTHHEDDALLQQPGIDVEGPLAAVCLLDHHGHKQVVVNLDRIAISHCPAPCGLPRGPQASSCFSSSANSAGLTRRSVSLAVSRM